MLRRTSRGWRLTLKPLTTPSPPVALRSVARKRIDVLLPAPLGADEAEHFAGSDFQIQAIDGDEVTVAFREIDEFDHWENRLSL